MGSMRIHTKVALYINYDLIYELQNNTINCFSWPYNGDGLGKFERKCLSVGDKTRRLFNDNHSLDVWLLVYIPHCVHICFLHGGSAEHGGPRRECPICQRWPLSWVILLLRSTLWLNPILTYEKGFLECLTFLSNVAPPHHLLFEFQTRPLGCFRLFSSFPVSLLDDRPSRKKKKKSGGWQIKQNMSWSISPIKTKASLIWHNRRRVDKQMLWPFISKKITLHHKECSGYSVSDNNREGSPA